MTTSSSGGPRLAVVDGVRTPFAKAHTDLEPADAADLGRAAVAALLARTGLDPGTVDEVILGCVGQPADAANVARVVALRAGIPERVPAVTVHRNCASGMEAITRAHQAFRCDRGSVFVVGGTESMSRAPFLLRHEAARKWVRLARARGIAGRAAALASFRPRDLVPRAGIRLGLTDPVAERNMGETAETLAREWGVTREEADAFALRSHRLAEAAAERRAEEIVPVYLPPRFERMATEDNGVRPGQTPEALARLRPVFDPGHGTVTAGNASPVTDGAVALLLMDERRARRLGHEPLGFLTGYAYAGCDPARMGLGPVHAIARAEEETGLRPGDADLVELNEAFAAQVLAVLRALESASFARRELGWSRAVGGIPEDRLNVNGGALALGHPVGATGARLVLTALRELRRRGGRRALATLCVGGGQGAALWLEREAA